MKRAMGLLLLSLLCSGLFSCTQERKTGPGKLQVITTLFPVYDFTRQVGGEKVDVHLLLPPGIEAHSFEPKPDDVVRINRASLFIFTSRYMEPWAEKLLRGADRGQLAVVESGEGAVYLPVGGRHDHGDEGGAHQEEQRQMDPHIWLSIPNAQKMVANIAEGLAAKDPANREYYRKNAAAYTRRLAELDERFTRGMADCRSHVLMHGGHYAFGYLAARYGLTYRAAYEISANAEPSPKKVVDLVREMKRSRVGAIFYEELLSPALADMIARETGADLVKLHGIHNVSKAEVEGGATYLSLMEQNLESLRKGLRCR